MQVSPLPRSPSSTNKVTHVTSSHIVQGHSYPIQSSVDTITQVVSSQLVVASTSINKDNVGINMLLQGLGTLSKHEDSPNETNTRSP